jgi:hypothetical protein
MKPLSVSVLISLCLSALLLAGCSLTYREKVGCRRAEVVLTAYGQAGDALAAACAEEVAAINASTGADQIPDAEVQVTPEAARANAEQIRAATAVRLKLKGFLGNLLDELGKRWPLFAAAGGLAAALWRSLAAKGAQDAVEGLVHAGMDLRDQAKDGKLVSEESVTKVLAFWNSLYGAGKVVKGALADAKAAWAGGMVTVPSAPATTKTVQVPPKV